MKYLEPYEDGEVDAFEEFMRSAIARRESEKQSTKLDQVEPVIKKPKAEKVSTKPLKEIAALLAYNPDTSEIKIRLNGKIYTYKGASPYIKAELLQNIAKNNKKEFFKTIRFLSNQ